MRRFFKHKTSGELYVFKNFIIDKSDYMGVNPDKKIMVLYAKVSDKEDNCTLYCRNVAEFFEKFEFEGERQ